MNQACRQLSLSAFVCGVALGQTAAGGATFDVISVKPAEFPGRTIARGGPPVRFGCFGGPGTSDPGRFTCNGASFSELVETAYHLRPYQTAMPDWMSRTYFNIDATVPRGTTPQQFHQMQQNLLAERFKLTAHFERKELAAYDLKIAKDGPKFKETEADPAAEHGIVTGDYQEAGGRVHHKSKETMDELAWYLTVRSGRPVFDATGLTALYDIALDFVQEPAGPGPGRGPLAAGAGGVETLPEPVGGPTLAAAVQAQLGLRLEPRKGMVDVLVVEHAQRLPTEN